MATSVSLQTDETEPIILVDTHVHLHQCFDLGKVFTKTAQNFERHAVHQCRTDAYSACLLLTEMAGEDWFARQGDLINQADGSLPIGEGWSLETTAESLSLLAVHSSGAKLAIVAGRQIVTQERLEVLALATLEEIPDGLPLNDTVHKILALAGIPVLPWGVGKWVGRRGKTIQQYLLQDDKPRVFLGDNSGRPLGWKRPSLFELSEQKGVPVLSGTDPLALPVEASKIGSFGIQIPGCLNYSYPAKMIYHLLEDSPHAVESYGRLEKPWNFVLNQVALRRQKALSVH